MRSIWGISMLSRNSSRAGFTLVELIIAVAILGILATLAVPNFIRLQLRGKMGEARTNLAAMRSAEQARYAELGNYVWAGSAPGGVPGPGRRAWAGGNALEFRELLGWVPDGDVHFQYGANAKGDAYTLTAIADVDGDGALSQFAVVHPEKPGTPGLLGEVGTCSRLGVYNRKTDRPDLVDTIGPCGARDGRSQF